MPAMPRVTRRNFLLGTAAALGAPYVISSSALGEADRPAPSNRVVMGGIGVGGQGSGDMKAFLSNATVQVVAVCDVDKSHRDAFKNTVDRQYGSANACEAYNDFRQVLARPDIDAVMIATPDHWHAPISVAAAKAGTDIYCEKPMTLTIAEGRAVADAVSRYGRVFQCGSQQRSGREFRTACELVRNGRIGKLQRIEVGIPGNNKSCPPTCEPEPVPEGFDYNLWLGQAPWEPYVALRCHYTFRFILDYSGGQVTNWGAHHLDIAQWGNGSDDTGPVEVEGHGEFPTTGLFTTATRVDFTCKYANGVTLVCKTGGGAKIDGEEGLGGGTKFIGADGWVHVNRGKLDASPKSILSEPIGASEIHLYESRGHQVNFIECCRTRRLTAAPVEVGHRSSTICHLGNIAMLLGRKLRWDPAKEQFPDDPDAQRMTWRPMRSPWRV
ncbi:MAG: Gfo/Idh/MocA family oxidoreductase [Planctomycetota bacterium]|nr:Gfo/Idh/MocA family oxidoreductase [Planctomycetota bacterium]